MHLLTMSHYQFKKKAQQKDLEFVFTASERALTTAR
jgi:hypothetical protein